MKFGCDWPSSLTGKVFENGGHIHVIAMGAGRDTPLVIFIKINYSVNLVL